MCSTLDVLLQARMPLSPFETQGNYERAEFASPIFRSVAAAAPLCVCGCMWRGVAGRDRTEVSASSDP